MRRSSPGARLAAAAIIVLLGSNAAAQTGGAQTADELFDASTVHDLRLSVNERDVEQLRLDYIENTYYQADVEFRGLRVRNAAIRSRGNFSRRPVKPGLRVDFNRYVSGQRFLGLKSLVLDNLVQDATFLHESVTMAMFTRMGQAAPRQAYVRLFINGVYEGLYAAVESVDDDFLARAVDDSRGYVFDYEWQHEFYGEYLGEALAPYKARFKAETHAMEGDVRLYLPIHNLFADINRPQDAIWRESVERGLDVSQFLTHVAIEQFVSEADGLMGMWAMNNFYLYRPGNSGQHQVIPWDRDNSFWDMESSILIRTDQNLLFQGLMAHEDLRAFYLQAVEACARAAADGGWLELQINHRAAMIRAAVAEDRRKPFTDYDFEAGLAFLQQFARQRPGIVMAEIERLRK